VVNVNEKLKKDFDVNNSFKDFQPKEVLIKTFQVLKPERFRKDYLPVIFNLFRNTFYM
jgi:hypothetical protein